MSLAVAMTKSDETASAGPMRTCIATGAELPPERMIRFVIGPNAEVVPDLARRLPGRGLWLKAERAIVEQAIAKRLFAKAARSAATAAPELGQRVESLLLERVLEDLGRARRAGRAVAGFVRVEQMIGRGQAGLLIVPQEAEGDGLGKLAASGLPVERLGDAAALGRVFGREQAVYTAVARDDSSGRFIERIAGGAARWRGYRQTRDDSSGD